MRRVLVIAGDRDQPGGDFRSSIEVIDGGALQRHGIVEIGIAGYPDGHPRISRAGPRPRAGGQDRMSQRRPGWRCTSSPSSASTPQAILKWIGRLRDFGVEHPVRVGLPGPTNLATLLRYARRCGVRASAQGLARQAGLVRQLFAMSTPDVLVRAIAEARAHRHLGEIAPHFFSFGGLAQARTVGRGGGRAPHRARARGRIPGRAAAHESVMRRLDAHHAGLNVGEHASKPRQAAADGAMRHAMEADSARLDEHRRRSIAVVSSPVSSPHARPACCPAGARRTFPSRTTGMPRRRRIRSLISSIG